MNDTPMRSAPDQHELKCLLSDIVKHGNKTKVANILGVSPSDISQRFDAENETRKLALAEGLREVWAICGADQEAGRKLRSYIEGLFDCWLDSVKVTDKNLSCLLSDASQDALSLLRARSIDGKPVHVQREQALAVRATIDQFIAGLESQELRAVG